MDFGRPDQPSSVDWRLPPDSSLTQLTLKQLGPSKDAELYIGSTAWAQKELVGEVYPPKTKSADYLQAYGRQFNSIELNTTYYRTPDHRQVLKWYAATPDDFRFCPKVNKAISQRGDLGIHSSSALDFVKAVQHFEHKLGPCFIQLPPGFDTSKVDALRAWLDAWPPTARLAVELRHASWFSESAGLDLFAELVHRGIGTVITDVGGRRDVAHMHLTADFVVVRWVGTLHDSDRGRLADWAKRLRSWYAAGLREAYVFTHQPEPVPSARSAAALLSLYRSENARPQVSSRAPVIGVQESNPPRQSELFD